MKGAHDPGRTSLAPGSWVPHAALLVVQVAFASQAVEGKLAMRPVEEGGGGLAPTALAMARMLGGAVFFLAASSLFRWRKKTTLRDQLSIAVLAVFGIVLNQTLFLVGLRLTSPVSAALLSVTIPVFTAALAVLFRVERPHPRTFFGLALAVAGVLYLTGVTSVDRGAVLVTVNSLSYSLYLVIARRTLQRLGALTVITWMFVWATLLFAPFAATALRNGVSEWTPRGWAFALYIVAVPTIVAYVFNAWALARTSPIVVTVYVCLQPLLAALLAWAQIGTVPGSRTVIAAALILLGVGIVASRKARPAGSFVRDPRDAGEAAPS